MKLHRRRIILALAAAIILAASIGLYAEEGDDDAAPVKKIKLTAENWKWTPDIIRVKQGTKLIIEAYSYRAPRIFLLKKYGLKVKIPQEKVVTFEFVADRVGEFKWKCGRPCGNGCAKMVGTLVVLE